MSYFQPYLDDTGLHFPTYDDVMEHLVANYKNIMGTDMYLGEDTQDYQMLSLFARTYNDLQAVILDVYNARNPNWATGVSLDSLLALTGIRRLPATHSTVTLSVTGTSCSVLPSGVIAMDELGNSWRTTEDAEFGEDGHAMVPAICTVAGRVLAPSHTITTIGTPLYNWESVDNPAAAVPGRDLEDDASARARRNQSVAVPGRSTRDGIQNALVNLPGVLHAVVLENKESVTDSATGIPAHSICAIVQEGDAQEIARAIYLKKAPGIGTHGNVSEVYTDVYGNQNTIRFDRPSIVNLSIHVTLQPLSGFNQDDMVPAIQRAIADSVEGLGIGESLIVPTLYSACYTGVRGSATAFAVTSITVQGHSGQSIIAASFDQKFTASISQVTVNVAGGA